MPCRPDWDVICVGAGITSLAFCATLAVDHPQTRVLVVDKHSIPGGYATHFRRPKVAAEFECSLHKLSGMAPGGNLRRIIGRLTRGSGLRFTEASGFFDYIGAGPLLALGADEAEVERLLCGAFPGDAAAISRFFEDVRTHGRNGYFQFQILSGERDAPLEQLQYARRHLRGITVAEKFAAEFRNDALKDLLAAPGIYVGGFPEQMSYLYYLHVIYATLNQGSAYLAGSAQQLSDHLVALIRANGGEVLLSNPARRLLWDESLRVAGVETRLGVFRAPQVYLNAAPKYAVGALLADLQPSTLLESRLAALQNSNSVTTLYLLTDVAPASLGIAAAESMIHGHGYARSLLLRRAASDEATHEAAYWSAGTMEVTNYHAVEASCGHVLVANVLDVVDHWPIRKSPGYKPKKRRAERVLFERLCAAYPQLAGHVGYLELSTPRTYERFTNNTAGAGFGAMVGVDASGFAFQQSFPIGGVRFLSSWVAGPGYEAAFGYGEAQARQWMRSAALAAPADAALERGAA
ncbi:MAG TPA: NAD(P)-binding protein [Caulobacteraceae bacterium]|jgi:phytoene dehydrogenase-like protein